MKITNSKLRKIILIVCFPFIFIFGIIISIIYSFLQEWEIDKWFLIIVITIIALNLLLLLQI